MSEKDADDNFLPTENGNDTEVAQALSQEEDNLATLLDGQPKEKENELDLCLRTNESSRKEENPFSFKKFLNQDLSAQKNKGARKKVFTMPTSSTSSNKLDLSDHNLNRNSSELNLRVVSATDKSSVLPDFVQDHLVVEQCNQNRSSDMNLHSLNHQSFPDLNLNHRNMHFLLHNGKETNQRSQILCNQFSPDLPDFTLGASNFQSVAQSKSNSERLPDFTLHARTNDSDESAASKRNLNPTNHVDRGQQRVQFSSSPSVPLDLPSYENNKSNQNLFIPFDLTAPANEKTSSCRGRSSNETVSKSLPDFLSDGPIKKELGENLLNCRKTTNLTENRLPSTNYSSNRTEDRLHREIDLLRHQLLEKNRVIENLERNLELLHSTDQRETASLECALQEVENNLKQTVKRALNAEDMVLKLRQENKLLKSEISSLRSENVELRLGSYDCLRQPSEDKKNQKVAKELRSAASKAEMSLRSLLKGLENLRALADSIENAHKFQEETKQYQNFFGEDSASGPAL